MTNPTALITYTNYMGKKGQRLIKPIRIEWSASQWHPEPQWVLVAYDVDKQAERFFAMKDIGSWQ